MSFPFSSFATSSNGTLKRRRLGLDGNAENVVERATDFKTEEDKTTLRMHRFERNLDRKNEIDGYRKVIMEESMVCKKREFEKLEPKSHSFKNEMDSALKEICEGVAHSANTSNTLPEPAILYSPRARSELDAAALKLQKVYRSYRTRRNLADCAIVIEELWWKALDFAELRRSSVSFFDIKKPETASSRWVRAKARVAKVAKGLSKDEKAQQLAIKHWLEAIDPRHRYGHNLHLYYGAWVKSESFQPFFYWLDIGEGKEVNLDECPRSDLHCQCIKYLGQKEREAYEVIVDNGKLVFRQSAQLVETAEGTKWIFVLGTTRKLYVGEKKKGQFQHSSFLSGGAATAAGRLVVHNGVLEAIWPYSGHYRPTEENFVEIISFLEEHMIDLTNVKKFAVDDDEPPKIPKIEPKFGPTRGLSANAACTNGLSGDMERPTIDVGNNCHTDGVFGNNGEVPGLKLAKRLSRKWTSRICSRIKCIREYPAELRIQALDEVKLSPKIAPGTSACPNHIPSPSSSPKILFVS